MAENEMTTEEMRELYEVEGFLAPFVVVRRKSDGQRGSLQFTHSPRRYFGWTPDMHVHNGCGLDCKRTEN